ncbi:MAG: pyruvate dehydrogenase (acetyl-transferring) E1 component subunit alpha [Armatimonadetes bacterium]|nr:pyruvate dehydrogenase (acetyl-transferring) E1 component subunit alpha [Armatimonadota bacterium]
MAVKELFAPTGLYQVLSDDGELLSDRDPGLSDGVMARLYEAMARNRILDQRMLNLQRQGRIAFYGMIHGQEAATMGSALALEDRDWLFPALREGGAAILRGMSLGKVIAQVMGNDLDDCRGRQMPCHPSSLQKHHVSMSSCIANQTTQAAGAAHAAKIRKDDVVIVSYVGDGGTSEPDFHAAMNWAGVYQLPLVMICQNNQWAISVPVTRQTASETIAVKALAYGMEGVRVDGNDALAVYAATKRAVDKARAGDGPTFLELVTYRMGGHTSADDPTRYRSEDEVEAWRRKDPLTRLRRFLEKRGLWDDEKQASLEKSYAEEISAAVEEAEKHPLPPPASMVEDVYAALPWHLREQQEEIIARGASGHGNSSN